MRRFSYILFSFIFLTAFAAAQQPYKQIITGEYVRNHFKLKAGEVVKLEEFKKKTYPTATVVWGMPDKRDAVRIQAGIAPSGSKLMVVFTELKNAREYDRVPATYKDAVVINGVGQKAVWSRKWKQLSVLMTPKLLVHVHLDHTGVGDLKTELISIARDIENKVK